MREIIILFSLFLLAILGLDFFTKSGFFYNLDSVFYPVYELQNFFSKTFFFHIWDLGMLINYELFSKFLLILCLLSGIFFGYKVAKYFLEKFEIQNKNVKIFISISSIFFAISNPFIYERLVSQVGIAFGVFCLGIGFVYLLEFFEKNENKKLYFSALFFGFSLNFFPHSAIFLLIFGIFSLIFFFKKFSFKNIFFAGIIFFSLNFNWLIGNFFLNSNPNGVSNTISTFNIENVEAFTQNSIGFLGVELTAFLGYGFWGEKYGHVFFPNPSSFVWIFFTILVFGIIFLGAKEFYKKDKKIFYFLISMYVIFFVLALGISSPVFSWFNNFLYQNVPYYIGMREPGKFLGFLAIVNNLFFIIGLYFSLKFLKNKLNIEKNTFDLYLSILIIFIIVNGYNPGMLWGFKGQLEIVKYPEEYFESKDFLEKREEFRNVILPWHSYMSCNWGTKKIFSNTYPNIINFSENIKSDNIEIGKVYTNYDNFESKQVEKFLETKDLALLKELGVKNIIFQDKCADFENYKFLENLDGLEKIFDKEFLKIYKIKYEKE